MQVRRITPDQYRKICLAALILLGIIVVTGAAVRLTGSGLGCSDWPRCNNEKLVDVSSKHAAIEQVNRLFTGLVAFGVIGAVLGSLVRTPRRRDLTWLSLGLVAGLVGQIVLGGIVVLVHLHPVAVLGHFALSMVLVANAVVLWVRAGDADAGKRISAVVPTTRHRVHRLVFMTAAALIAGTVVTGTGPHAGDRKARRFFGSGSNVSGTALKWMSRIHSGIVWLAVATAVLLFWHLRNRDNDRRRLDGPLTAWVCLAFGQGAVGYIQYASGLPAGLVALHVALATTLWATSVYLWTHTTRMSPSVRHTILQSTRADDG